jgi:hypothetical protein
VWYWKWNYGPDDRWDVCWPVQHGQANQGPFIKRRYAVFANRKHQSLLASRLYRTPIWCLTSWGQWLDPSRPGCRETRASTFFTIGPDRLLDNCKKWHTREVEPTVCYEAVTVRWGVDGLLVAVLQESRTSTEQGGVKKDYRLGGKRSRNLKGASGPGEPSSQISAVWCYLNNSLNSCHDSFYITESFNSLNSSVNKHC